MNAVIDVIDNCFGFKGEQMKDKKTLIYQNLKKKRYLKNEIIYCQNEQLDLIYIINKGEVKLVQQILQQNDRKPISRMKQVTKYKEYEFSLINSRQFINQETIFQDKTNFTAKVISQKCSVYYIEKKVLLKILNNECNDFLQNIVSQQYEKDHFYQDIMRLKNLNQEQQRLHQQSINASMNENQNALKQDRSVKFVEHNVSNEHNDNRRSVSQYYSKNGVDRETGRSVELQNQSSRMNQYSNQFNQNGSNVVLQKKFALAVLDKIDKNEKFIQNYQKSHSMEKKGTDYDRNQQMLKTITQSQEKVGRKQETYLKNLKYKPLDLLRMKAQNMYEQIDNNSSQQKIQTIHTINSNNISSIKINARCNSMCSETLDENDKNGQSQNLHSLPKLNTLGSSSRYVNLQNQYNHNKNEQVEKINQGIYEKQARFKNSIQNRKLRKQYIKNQKIEISFVE